MVQNSRSLALAIRRRNELLSHEEYGPAYVHLTNRERARIDALIEARQGRTARVTLMELDAARRERERQRSRARRRLALARKAAHRAVELSTEENSKALAFFPTIVRRLTEYATDDELRAAATDLPWEEWQDLATPQYVANPLWYHYESRSGA